MDRKMIERKEICKNKKYQAFNVLCKDCMPRKIRIKCLRLSIKEGELKLANERKMK